MVSPPGLTGGTGAIGATLASRSRCRLSTAEPQMARAVLPIPIGMNLMGIGGPFPEDCSSLGPLSADLAAPCWPMSHRADLHVLLGHGPSGCA